MSIRRLSSRDGRREGLMLVRARNERWKPDMELRQFSFPVKLTRYIGTDGASSVCRNGKRREYAHVSFLPVNSIQLVKDRK